MSEENNIQKSLIEQIFNEMFMNIEKSGELDKKIIQELKNLAVNGELNKVNKVMNVIQLSSKE
ncbi:MAG: hypothetical protein ABRQ39_08485 [Candidatus Eremiobacterota bacterium]